MKAANVCGQAYGFMAMTPIKAGEEDNLRRYLESLGTGAGSPLSKVPRTHMARWLIADSFRNDPPYGRRKPETLGVSWLVFSTNFDGDLDSYLNDLWEALRPEVSEIWGRCIGYEANGHGTELQQYLKRNQVDCGFFYAAYGEATVEQVRASLEQRDRLLAFAIRAQGWQPDELRQSFIREFAS